MDPITLAIVCSIAAYITAAPDSKTASVRGGVGGAIGSASRAGARSARSDWKSWKAGRVARSEARLARQRKGMGRFQSWLDQTTAADGPIASFGRSTGEALASAGRAVKDGYRSGRESGQKGLPKAIRDRLPKKKTPQPAAHADPTNDPAATPGASPTTDTTTPAPTGEGTHSKEKPVTTQGVDIESYEDLLRELGEVEKAWEADADPLLEATNVFMTAWAEHYENAVAAAEKGKAIEAAALDETTDGDPFVPGKKVLDALEGMSEILAAIIPILTAVDEAAQTFDATSTKSDQVSEVITEAIEATKAEAEIIAEAEAETGAKVKLNA